MSVLCVCVCLFCVCVSVLCVCVCVCVCVFVCGCENKLCGLTETQHLLALRSDATVQAKLKLHSVM